MIPLWIQSLQKQTMKILINLNFAIALFFLISFYGVCGSILEQERSNQYYLETYDKILPILNIKMSTLIFAFNLDHVFSTFWFYFLITLFGLSLITCSLTRQLPFFLISRGNKFFYKSNFPKNFQIYKQILANRIFYFPTFFQKQQYLLFQKKGVLYNYKGLLGKFAPLLVHLSLILILLGTCIASLTSFSAQELVPKSEIFTVENAVKKNLFTRLPNYSMRINDFWITYDKDENIQQYFSDISILDQMGKECQENVISVNKPLRFKNLTVYQTDWDLIAIRLKFKDQTIHQFPLNKVEKNTKSWYSLIKIKDDTFYLVVNSLNGIVQIYDEKGQFMEKLEFEQEFRDFKILDVIPRTGIELKIDEGIPVLYLGFFLLMGSVIFSSQYFPEIWLLKNNMDSKFFVAGKTNRQEVKFNIEISKILENLETIN